MKERSEEFNRIQEFEKVIHTLLPEASFSGMSFIGDGTNEIEEFEAEISPSNLFENSIYETKERSLIHFTSLQSLFAILSLGFFRMSEFGHLEDKNEILYGASVFSDHSIFNFNTEKIDNLKKNIFCFSSCISNEETKKNNYMWHVYANKRKGCFIEYEINPPNPHFYNIVKVLYGKGELKNLEKLRDAAISFKRDKTIFPSNFTSLILEIEALHKSKQYSSEEEIRIIYKVDNPFGNPKTIYKDFNANNELKNFNKLYIEGRNPYVEKENNGYTIQ